MVTENVSVDVGNEGVRSQEAPSQQATARLLAIARHSESVPSTKRAGFEMAASGQGSPRSAIKAKCNSCVGYEDSTSRIRDCSCHGCPLWAFRPYQESA